MEKCQSAVPSGQEFTGFQGSCHLGLEKATKIPHPMHILTFLVSLTVLLMVSMEKILNKLVCLNISWLAVGVVLWEDYGFVAGRRKGVTGDRSLGCSSVLLLAPISFYSICQDASKQPNTSAVTGLIFMTAQGLKPAARMIPPPLCSLQGIWLQQ